MNRQLTEQIARHILANLGVISVSFMDYEKSQSLHTKDFLLEQKLLFKNEQDQIIKNPIYGCQITVEQKQFKILLGDCSQDKNVPEFCLVVQLTGLPAYGLYMVCDPSLDSEAVIAVSINDKDWMPCSTFLQATFLAAMEQLKDTGLGWVKCTNYQKHYEMLSSLIKFHTAYWEVENEGQESAS
jgi:hypothetical protein